MRGCRIHMGIEAESGRIHAIATVPDSSFPAVCRGCSSASPVLIYGSTEHKSQLPRLQQLHDACVAMVTSTVAAAHWVHRAAPLALAPPPGALLVEFPEGAAVVDTRACMAVEAEMVELEDVVVLACAAATPNCPSTSKRLSRRGAHRIALLALAAPSGDGPFVEFPDGAAVVDATACVAFGAVVVAPEGVVVLACAAARPNCPSTSKKHSKRGVHRTALLALAPPLADGVVVLFAVEFPVGSAVVIAGIVVETAMVLPVAAASVVF